MQRDLCVCFIDYKKAFDSVKDTNLTVMQNDIKIDSKNLRYNKQQLRSVEI